MRKSKGFALLELLVVLLIVGMATAIVVPSMSRAMTAARLKTTSRDVLNILRIARETAIKEQATHKVRVDFVKKVILLTDVFGETRSQYPFDKDIVVEAVRIEGAEAARQEVVDIFFYPEGNATGAELVLLMLQTEHRVVLRTDAVTGTVRIIPEKEAGGR